MKSATRNNGVDQSWDLSGTGDWNSFTNNGTTQEQQSNGANETTAITDTSGTRVGIQPVYDNAGDMTTLPSPSDSNSPLGAQYDAWGRLVHATSGSTVVSYQYDGTGRLVECQSGGTTDYYFYAGSQVVENPRDDRAQSATSAPVLYQYVWSARSNAPILRDTYTTTGGVTAIDPSQRIYYLTDADNNVTALVGINPNTGDWQVVERYVYNAYGTATIYVQSLTDPSDQNWTTASAASSVGNTILFASESLDPATGLYCDGVRWYDASMGTFVSRDPLGLSAGSNTYQVLREQSDQQHRPQRHGRHLQPERRGIHEYERRRPLLLRQRHVGRGRWLKCGSHAVRRRED